MTNPHALAGDPAQGKSTLIRKALEYVRARYEGRDLVGIVLVSDGAATGSFDEDSGDGAVRDFLCSLDTRVHTVWAARDDTVLDPCKDRGYGSDQAPTLNWAVRTRNNRRPT